MSTSGLLPTARRAALLELKHLEVVYGGAVLALRGVSLSVPADSIVALLGANGAGKTTLLRATTGLLPAHRGRVMRGSINWRGSRIDPLDPVAAVRRGISQVMEGRRIFAELSVDENLRAGAYVRGRRTVDAGYDRVMQLFPRLRERRRLVAGYLSGGEQQMLAIGRALMQAPTLLLLDEPTLGLAPLVIQQIKGVIAEIHRQGTSIVLVEQNAALALAVADYGYILSNGRIVRGGTSAELRADPEIQKFYLGMAADTDTSDDATPHGLVTQ